MTKPKHKQKGCGLCRALFIPTSGRQKYCPECAKVVERKKKREYNARNRSNPAFIENERRRRIRYALARRDGKCPHGNDYSTCEKCRLNRLAQATRDNYTPQYNILTVKSLRSMEWKCTGCGEAHNTTEEKECYVCHKPR